MQQTHNHAKKREKEKGIDLANFIYIQSDKQLQKSEVKGNQ